jgi:hypothetical protein
VSPPGRPAAAEATRSEQVVDAEEFVICEFVILICDFDL